MIFIINIIIYMKNVKILFLLKRMKDFLLDISLITSILLANFFISFFFGSWIIYRRDPVSSELKESKIRTPTPSLCPMINCFSAFYISNAIYTFTRLKPRVYEESNLGQVHNNPTWYPLCHWAQ